MLIGSVATDEMRARGMLRRSAAGEEEGCFDGDGVEFMSMRKLRCGPRARRWTLTIAPAATQGQKRQRHMVGYVDEMDGGESDVIGWLGGQCFGFVSRSIVLLSLLLLRVVWLLW